MKHIMGNNSGGRPDHMLIKNCFFVRSLNMAKGGSGAVLSDFFCFIFRNVR